MIEQNPYEAPKANVNVGSPGIDGEVPLMNAGLGARFLNLLIDYVMVIVLGAVAGFIAVLAAGQGALEGLAGNFIGIIVMVGYYVFFEGLFGWTIGKLITGTRVIRIDGGKPGFLKVLGRTAARFIPFEPFSLLFGSSNAGWHDSLPGTRVVKVRR
jgi:uncharacterized RDD family membrane protein YckC